MSIYMYERVKRLYLEGRIDADKGLTNAVKFGWITEEQKQEIINYKKSIESTQG